MAIHRFTAQDYFDGMTDPSLRWVQDVARATGKHCGAIRMAEDPDGRVPVTQMIMLRPGAVVPRHANDCHVVQVVVIGSLLVEDGEPAITEGDIMVAKPGEYHGPLVAGPHGALVAAFITDVNAKVTFTEELPILDDRIADAQSAQ